MAKSETPARDAVIVKYLNEAYGKEKQLETQLAQQIELAKRPQLTKGFKDHLKVTKAQSRGLAKRIRELGGKADDGGITTAAENLGNRALSAAKGPLAALRGTSEADNDLRAVRDSLWHEAEEIAHYDTIEAVAKELGDTETAKLARQYRKEEEKMQGLLERQIPALIKAVVKEEVPAAERRKSGGTRRRKSTRSRSTSRSTASRSTGSTGGATKAKRSAAGKKAAATRARKSATSSAKSTATSARTTAKKAGTTARKAGSAARKTAGASTRSTTTSRSTGTRRSSTAKKS